MFVLHCIIKYIFIHSYFFIRLYSDKRFSIIIIVHSINDINIIVIIHKLMHEICQNFYKIPNILKVLINNPRNEVVGSRIISWSLPCTGTGTGKLELTILDPANPFPDLLHIV